MSGHELDNTRTNSLAALALTLLIVVVSLVVVRKLQVRCMMETCMISAQPGYAEVIERLRASRMFAGN